MTCSLGLVMVLASAAAASSAAPQDPIAGSSSVLWFEPVSTGISSVAGRYEHVVAPRLSVSAGAEAGGFLAWMAGPDQATFDTMSGALGANVGLSHYLGAQALSGPYLHGRFGVIGSLNSFGGGLGSSSTGTSIGPYAAAMFGYSVVMSGGFAAQAAMGLRGGYQWMTSRFAEQEIRSTQASISPAANLSVGWAF